MERREFVRLLVAAAMSRDVLAQQASEKPSLNDAPAPAPIPWSLGDGQLATVSVPQTKPQDVAQFHPAFFTTVQMATLRRLSASLLPPIAEMPGAVQAATPEFLDAFIGESDEASRQLYQEGLDWLEASAHKQFALPFALLNDTQSDGLIRPWLRTWMADHLPTEPRAHFINAVHADIRLATVNSPVWDRALAEGGHVTPERLYWLPIEPDIFKLHVASAKASR